ncbi:hypothetical protein [Agromyces sp. S2-1-8]|uniref:hypothetical protein n=1 Tax=Agromyces sp. S2-1-8 TaxID=2897180 RepID=UPI001E4B2C99|nr:hypothetical protein [Agromyces sp. S2-1-8]MCD5348412.1 hypothetical protein [Agromyces sp. S2-1-8]
MSDPAAKVLEEALGRTVDRRLRWSFRTADNMRGDLLLTGKTQEVSVDLVQVAVDLGGTHILARRRRKNARQQRVVCNGILPDGRGWLCELVKNAPPKKRVSSDRGRLVTGPIPRARLEERTRLLAERDQRLAACRRAGFRVVITKRLSDPKQNAYHIIDILQRLELKTTRMPMK